MNFIFKIFLITFFMNIRVYINIKVEEKSLTFFFMKNYLNSVEYISII